MPTGTCKSPGYYVGARDFWRMELQKLKYWNPSLTITVETVRDESGEAPMYLSVEYESSDKDELSKLKATPLPKPLFKLPAREFRKRRGKSWPATPNAQKEKIIAQSHAETRQRRQETTPSVILEQLNGQLLLTNEPLPKVKLIKPITMTPDIASHAPSDEITIKAQPAADPSQPQSTSPPATVYSRTVTTPLAGLRHNEIWQWLRQHTGLPDHQPPTKEEEHKWQELVKFKQQADKDRKMVKAGLKLMRGEQAQLRKAKALADQMAAENI